MSQDVELDVAVNPVFQGKARELRDAAGGNASLELRLDDPGLSADLRSALAELDSDGSGVITTDEIRRAGQFIRADASSLVNRKGEMNIRIFPKAVQDALAPFDPDGDGTISPEELVMAANAMKRMRREVQYMKRAIAAFVAVFLLFGGTIFGLTYAVVELTKETHVDEETPNLTAAGSGAVVRTASSDTRTTDGVFRARDSGSAVATDAVTSYVTLTDLLTMPLTIIDAVEDLTFMTVDGVMHNYPKMGVKLTKGNPANDTAQHALTLYTSIPGISVYVVPDAAFLREETFITSDNPSVPTFTEVRIDLPTDAEVNERRRQLFDAPDSDLHRRCHAVTGACLHTRREIMHLHGHLDFEVDGSGRFLQDSSSGSGVAYAEVKKDAFGINEDSGYLSWTSEAQADVVSSAEETDEDVESEATIEYDSWGCIMEEGFETRAYPLTVKHCYAWRYTKHCDYTLDDSTTDPGLALAIASTASSTDFYDLSSDAACTDLISKDSSGYCECGSGLKIRVGVCGGDTTDFTCADKCLERARSTGEMTIDLYSAHDERLVKPFDLDEILTKELFDVDERVEGDYTASVQDSVYYSMRLAYRRETSRYFGVEGWPEWLDWDRNVAAHYTPENVADDGETWADASGKGRTATTAGGTLTTRTLFDGGPELDTTVVSGSTATTLDFPSDLFPPTVYVYEEGANFAECGEDCIDLTSTVASALDQISDFTEWYAASGADRDRRARGVREGVPGCGHRH